MFTSHKWIAGAALAAALTPAAQAVPTLAFDLSSLAVNVGDSFDLVLQGSGFDTTSAGLVINNVSGGRRIDLMFSAGALEIVSVTIDPRWNLASGNKAGTVDNAAGTLSGMSFATIPATTDDDFNIARISFKAVGAAPAAVVVTADDVVGRVNNVTPTRIFANFVASNVQVSPVPEPQTWALLVAGLGCVALRVRRGA